jgi:hypothetical protein
MRVSVGSLRQVVKRDCAPRHPLHRRWREGMAVASGEITLRRIDGWRRIAAVLGQHLSAA